jgi:hypothetical protein
VSVYLASERDLLVPVSKSTSAILPTKTPLCETATIVFSALNPSSSSASCQISSAEGAPTPHVQCFTPAVIQTRDCCQPYALTTHLWHQGCRALPFGPCLRSLCKYSLSRGLHDGMQVRTAPRQQVVCDLCVSTLLLCCCRGDTLWKHKVTINGTEKCEFNEKDTFRVCLQETSREPPGAVAGVETNVLVFK